MSNTLNETLFQAIDTIVSKRIEEVIFDETIQCTVVSRLTKDGNEYEVKNNSVIYKAIAKDGEEYDVNDRVCVSILKNGKDRIILGKYTLEQEDALEYNDPFDKLVVSKEWLPIEGQTNPEISLDPSSASSESQTIKIAEENRLAITLEGYDFMGIEFGVDVLGLNPHPLPATGRWAIEIVLLDSKNSSLFKFDPQSYNIKNMELVSPYLLSSTEIYGNPYALTANFPQRKLFHFPKGLQLPEIAAVQINLHQSGDYTLADEEGKLILKNLKICFGFDANKYLESPIHLYVEGDYNNTFGYTDSEHVGLDNNGKPAIKVLLIDQANKKIINELSENQSILWYQHKIGEKGDAYGGGYWDCIEEAGEKSTTLDPEYYTLNLDRPNTQIKAVLCEDKPVINFDAKSTQTLIFDDRRGENGWWDDKNSALAEEDQIIIYEDTKGNIQYTYVPRRGENKDIRQYGGLPFDSESFKDAFDQGWLRAIYDTENNAGAVEDNAMVAIIDLQKNIFLQEKEDEKYNPIRYYQYAGKDSGLWIGPQKLEEINKMVLGTSLPFVFDNITAEEKNADGIIQIDTTIGTKMNKNSWPIYDSTLLDPNTKFGTLVVKPVPGAKWETINPTKITWSIVRGGLLTGLTTNTKEDLQPSRTIENIEEDIENKTKIFFGLAEKFDETQAIAACNIIKCTINDSYTTTVSFSFSKLNSQGTNYTFRIEPVDSKYLLNGLEETQLFQAILETSDGISLKPEDYQLTWSWKQSSSYHNYDTIDEESNKKLNEQYPTADQDRLLLYYNNSPINLTEAIENIVDSELSDFSNGDFSQDVLYPWVVNGAASLINENGKHSLKLLHSSANIGRSTRNISSAESVKCSQHFLVQPNKVYQIRFKARANIDNTLCTSQVICSNDKQQQTHSTQSSVYLTNQFKIYSYFVYTKISDNAILEFEGNINNTNWIELSDVQVIQHPFYAIPPIEDEYADLWFLKGQAWDHYTHFTTEDAYIGRGCLELAGRSIAGGSGGSSEEGLDPYRFEGIAQLKLNIVSGHEYYCSFMAKQDLRNWGHPSLRYSSWDDEKEVWISKDIQINNANSWEKIGFTLQSLYTQPELVFEANDNDGSEPALYIDNLQMIDITKSNSAQDCLLYIVSPTLSNGWTTQTFTLQNNKIYTAVFEDQLQKQAINFISPFTLPYENGLAYVRFEEGNFNLYGCDENKQNPVLLDSVKVELEENTSLVKFALFTEDDLASPEEAPYQYYITNQTASFQELHGHELMTITEGMRQSYNIYQKFNALEASQNIDYKPISNDNKCLLTILKPFDMPEEQFNYNNQMRVQQNRIQLDSDTPLEKSPIQEYYLFPSHRMAYYNKVLGVAHDFNNMSQTDTLFKFSSNLNPVVGLNEAVIYYADKAEQAWETQKGSINNFWYDENKDLYHWIEIKYVDIDDAELSYASTWSCPKEHIYNFNILQASCIVNALYQTGNSETTTEPITLIAEYPIRILNLPSDDYMPLAKELKITGPYKLIWSDLDELQNPITVLEKNLVQVNEPFSIVREKETDDSIIIESVWKLATYEQDLNKIRYSISDEGNFLRISSNSVSKLGFETTKMPLGLVGMVQDNKELYIQTPLVLHYQLYTTDLSNKWSGGRVTINNKDATIMATAIGAGVKHDSNTNTFSGILMGNFKQNGKTITGLSGFYQDKNTFLLRAEDGTGIFTGQLNATGGTIANWQIGDFKDQSSKYTGALFSDAGRYRLFLRADYNKITDVAIGIKQYDNLEYTATSNKDGGTYIFYVSHNGSLRASNLSIAVNTYEYDLTQGVDNQIQSLSYTMNMGVCAPWFGVGHHSGRTGQEGIKNGVGWLLTERRRWQDAGATNSSPQLFIGTTFPVAKEAYAANKYKHSIISRYGYSFDIVALVGVQNNTSSGSARDKSKPAELRLIARNAYDLDHGSIISGLGPSIIEFKSDAFRFTGKNNDGINDTDNIKLNFTSDGFVKWEKVTT